jgi:hypothetical protein
MAAKDRKGGFSAEMVPYLFRVKSKLSFRIRPQDEGGGAGWGVSEPNICIPV